MYGAGLTAQKKKFSTEDFFSKCDQIRSFLRIWSHLLMKSLMENFIFCAGPWWMIKKWSIERTVSSEYIQNIYKGSTENSAIMLNHFFIQVTISMQMWRLWWSYTLVQSADKFNSWARIPVAVLIYEGGLINYIRNNFDILLKYFK